MYSVKRFLRALNGRLWPLAFLLVVLLILMASDAHAVHTLPLARTLLGGLHSDDASNFSSDLTEWAGNIIALIVGLLILRLIIGAFASDSKAFRRLNNWLLERAKTRSNQLQITKPFNPQEWSGIKPYQIVEKRASDTHKDILRCPLAYSTSVPAAAKRTTKSVRVEIHYQETAVNEAWRVRNIYETVGAHPARVPTPVLLLLSRIQSARDTALLERLGDPSQFVKLEGDFSDFFDLYIPKGSEVEALDVLTPDVMEVLEHTAYDIDIKFDNGMITFFKNGYILDTVELARFEQQIADTVAGLDRYLGKRAKEVRRKGWAELYSPAYIKPLSLYTDRLLGWGTILFFVIIAINLIIGFFSHARSIDVGEDTYTIMTPAGDVGALLLYAVLALLFVTFILGEIEVAIHRLRLALVTWQARRAYARKSLAK